MNIIGKIMVKMGKNEVWIFDLNRKNKFMPRVKFQNYTYTLILLLTPPSPHYLNNSTSLSL